MEISERTCYIHIGTHKTGTTSIQAFLALNRERLHASGVLIPIAGSDGDPGVATYHKLAHELNATTSCDVRSRLDAVTNELRLSKVNTACVSSEDFLFLWDKPAALGTLRDAIKEAGFAPRVVVFFRPQVPYLIAIYAENVRHGYRKPFNQYFDDVLTHGHYVWGEGIGPPFDYDQLLDPFTVAFGHNAVIAQTYRATAPSHALLASFAQIIGVASSDISRCILPPTRYNGSLDFGDVLTLLGVQHSISERLRFSPLSLAHTLQTSRRFRQSNAAATARYGINIPAFEPLDLVLAMPIRKTRAKTRALIAARRLLTQAHSSTDIGDSE